MSNPKIIAIANQKGGVAKTTSTVSIGADLAKTHGAKVLIVDMDSQGHSTYSLIGESKIGSINFLVNDDVSMEDVVFETGIENLYIMPNEKKIMGQKISLDKFFDASQVTIFRDKLEASSITKDFDYIIIDLGPKIGDFDVTTSLTAADYVLIPTKVGTLDMEGFTEMIEYVNRVKAVNPKLEILGIFFTVVDKRLRVSKSISTLREEFEDLFFENTIPQNSKFLDLAEERKTIFDVRSNKGATAYQFLVDEILERIEARESKERRPEARA